MFQNLALTLILWETDVEWAVLDLFCEEVLLVEEQDDGGVDEPLVVADGVEEFHTLHHAVHFFILGQNLGANQKAISTAPLRETYPLSHLTRS